MRVVVAMMVIVIVIAVFMLSCRIGKDDSCEEMRSGMMIVSVSVKIMHSYLTSCS